MINRARQIRKDRREREIKEETGGGTSGVSEKECKGMIKVTRLNGQALYVNFFQVEYLESIPETKIKMMNGDYYLVKDSVESVAEKVQEFINRCITLKQ